MNKYNAIKKETKVYKGKIVNQGFSLELSNDIYISVKFGTGSYSDEGKTTAEVAVIDSENNWYIPSESFDKLVVFPLGAEVIPRVTPDELVTILDLAKQL